MSRSRLPVRAVGFLRREGPVSAARSAVAAARFQSWKQYKTRLEPSAHQAVHRLRYGTAAPERYGLIHVDPRSIEYLLVPHFWNRVSKFTTHVTDGDWDENRTNERLMISSKRDDGDRPTLFRIDNYLLYVSAVEHFRNGTPWEETEVYEWLMDEWLQRDPETYMNRYGSERRVRSRLDGIDDLYDHIRQHGYLTQEELREREDAPFHSPALAPQHHEIAVNIGRDGRMIFDDGRHRFIVARILGLESIPVRVLVRHAEWQELRTEVSDAVSMSDLSPRAVKHLDHPDLQDVIPGSIRDERGDVTR